MWAQYCVLVIHPRGAEYCVLVSRKDSKHFFSLCLGTGVARKTTQPSSGWNNALLTEKRLSWINVKNVPRSLSQQHPHPHPAAPTATDSGCRPCATLLFISTTTSNPSLESEIRKARVCRCANLGRAKGHFVSLRLGKIIAHKVVNPGQAKWGSEHCMLETAFPNNFIALPECIMCKQNRSHLAIHI